MYFTQIHAGENGGIDYFEGTASANYKYHNDGWTCTNWEIGHDLHIRAMQIAVGNCMRARVEAEICKDPRNQHIEYVEDDVIAETTDGYFHRRCTALATIVNRKYSTPPPKQPVHTFTTPWLDRAREIEEEPEIDTIDNR